MLIGVSDRRTLGSSRFVDGDRAQQPLTGSVGDTRPPIKRETKEADDMMEMDIEMMMGGMMESGE